MEDLHASGGNLSAEAATQRTAPRIAVFPFANVSGDPDQDYFGEGIAAEILISLARIPGLHLIARSAVCAVNREALGVRDLGRLLDATAVLDGSVRLADDRLHLTVSLLDAATEQALWSARFDRAMQDVFAVLDEIAAGVADTFEVTTTPDRRKIQSIHTSNVEAYDFYLRGRRFYYQFSKHGIEAALQMF